MSPARLSGYLSHGWPLHRLPLKVDKLDHPYNWEMSIRCLPIFIFD